MKYNEKRVKELLIKLIIGVTIFLIPEWTFNYLEKPIFKEGTYSAFGGFAIFLIGESIWKTNHQQKNAKNDI